MDRYDPYGTDNIKNVIEVSNIVFFGIFFTELLIKLLGLGIKGYF